MTVIEFDKYDLELNFIYKEYCEGIDQTEIIVREGKDKIFYKEELKNRLVVICKIIGLDFEDFSIKLIGPENVIYYCILEDSLMFKNEYTIGFYLDHQIIQHPEKASKIVDFLQYYVLDNLKRNSPFDNKDRLDTIRKFIYAFKARQNRAKKAVQSTKLSDKKNKDKGPITDKLKYTTPILVCNYDNKISITILSKLSEEFFKNKITRDKLSFINVFIKMNQCNWKNDKKAMLGILLKKLKKDTYIKIAGDRINNGIFKVARRYFLDENEKYFAVKSITNSINKLKSTNPAKFAKLEKEVNDLIIKSTPQY